MAHPTTVARLISRAGFSDMECINFFRAEIYSARSKKLVGAIRQGTFCNCVIGGVDVARRHQGAGLRSYCSTLVDRVDLATPLSQSCRSVAVLSAPAPAKRAIAKRFRAMARSCGAGALGS